MSLTRPPINDASLLTVAPAEDLEMAALAWARTVTLPVVVLLERETDSSEVLFASLYEVV